MQSSLDLEQKTVVSFFESTIRLLGGLLSAFELSQEEMFLQKAQQLTDKLMISCEENYSMPFRLTCQRIDTIMHPSTFNASSIL